jgi:hypothetical protein
MEMLDSNKYEDEEFQVRFSIEEEPLMTVAEDCIALGAEN